MNHQTHTLIEQIGGLGYGVSLGSGDVQAIHERTGERFIVRSDDLDEMLTALAESVASVPEYNQEFGALL